jgi:myxalamid-type polyketide synthase MxaE and MxaD
VAWLRPDATPAAAWACLDTVSETAITGRGAVLDAEGAAILALEGIRFAAAGQAAGQTVADWLFGVTWHPAADAEEAPRLSGRWLIVAAPVQHITHSSNDIAASLAGALRQAGATPLVVADGDEPALALALAGPLAGIVHLAGLDVPAEPGGDVDEWLGQATASALRLIQAVKRSCGEAAVPIWLVTAGAQAVGGDAPAVGQAPLWGLGHVLAEEHHELWGGLIDLDPAAPATAGARLLPAALAAGDGEDRIALRGDQRFVARQERLAEDGGETRRRADAPAVRFRADGAYLLSGGFGDIAQAVARWMVGQGARRLILLGRTPLPPRSEWRRLPADSPAAGRARAILELEALGAAVHWAAVDVGDGPALSAFLDGYTAEGWPPIRGVVHSAAVVEDRLLLELDEPSLRRVAHAKAAGAYHLHRAFEDLPLDFFLLFSSSGALLGAAGQGNYAAANAFLDALAHARRAAGRPAQSINWGFWDNMGFANTPGGRRSVTYMAASGLTPFRPAEALAALEALLARPDIVQSATLKVDWPKWRRHSRLVGVPPFLRAMAAEEAGQPVPVEDVRGQLLALEAGPARLRRMQSFVREALAAVLRLEPATIELETPLGSLGIDSFTAIELRNRFERALGIQLSATLVWNYPTIAALAPFLAERMGLAPAAPLPVERTAAEPALDDDLAAFLAQADSLSEDDLRQLLNEL